MEESREMQNSVRQDAEISHVECVEHFQGPIPPPIVMGQYETVLSGAADRILKLAEQQAEHRIAIEKKVIDAKIRSEQSGKILGFIIVILVILIGAGLIMVGKNTAGLVSILGALTALLGAFMYGKKSNMKELDRKREENEE